MERMPAVDFRAFVIEGLDSLVVFGAASRTSRRRLVGRKRRFYTFRPVPKRLLGTGTGFADAKLSEILRLRARCSLAQDDKLCPGASVRTTNMLRRFC